MATRLSQTVNSALSPLGIQVRRIPSRISVDFYPVVPSCQITYLSHKYEQFIGRKTDGYFVEVGAYDGYSYSNSWGLAERGWNGMLIEPIEEFAEKCRRRHAHHPNVQVEQTAISADAEGLTFQVAGALTTASSDQISEFQDQGWAANDDTGRSVRTASQTLDAALRGAQVPAEFDVLIVDVEGHESSVFAGFTIAKWRPKTMIVELADTHPQLTAVRHEHAELLSSLMSAGYVVVYKDVINTMLVREDIYREGTAGVR